MRILLRGGAGFVGSNLAVYLRRRSQMQWWFVEINFTAGAPS